MAKGGDYSDRFQDVMSYVEVKLAEKREKRVIKSKEDLKKLFRELDAERKGGEKRFTEEFLNELVETREAEKITRGRGTIIPDGHYSKESGHADHYRIIQRNLRTGGGWHTRGYASNTSSQTTIPQSEKAQAARNRGAVLYPYHNPQKRRSGYAVVVVTYRKRGRSERPNRRDKGQLGAKRVIRREPVPQKRYRDTETGRFVSAKHIIEEE
jgi:hypothetical protein